MGPDLVRIFVERLALAGIPIRPTEHERGFVKAVKIGKSICMTKYANLSNGGTYFFGFTPYDVESNHTYSDAILLIGNGTLQRGYYVPYPTLCDYLRTGEPVFIPRQGYHSFKASIFPDRGHVFIVEKGNGRPFQIESYRMIDIDRYFKERFIYS